MGGTAVLARYRVAVICCLLLVALTAAACGTSEDGPRTRIELELQTLPDVDLNDAREQIEDIVSQRLEQIGAEDVEFEATSGVLLRVEVKGLLDEGDIERMMAAGRLMFCEPVMDDAGNVAIYREGTVEYEPYSCNPSRDASGNIEVNGGSLEFVPWVHPGGVPPEQIVWQPATAEGNGQGAILDESYLEPNAQVFDDRIIGVPFLIFELSQAGVEIDIMERITTRLAGPQLPLAPFLDGQPLRGDGGDIIAPQVAGVITTQGQVEGLSRSAADALAILINTGPLPVPVRVVEVAPVVEG